VLPRAADVPNSGGSIPFLGFATFVWSEAFVPVLFGSGISERR